MLQALKQRRENEEGFTLIELMVVVLIIAILLAIAIPTFLGARERAQNRAAQSDLRNALAAEKVFYTDDEVFTDNTGTALTDIEPSLEYGGTASETVVGVNVFSNEEADAAQAVCLGKESRSGNDYSILEVATGDSAGTWYHEDIDCGGYAGAAAAGGVRTGW